MSTDQAPPPYLYRPPVGPTLPFIFSVPHSGRHYPEDFTKRSTLNLAELRRSEDAFVDQFFETVPTYNAALLIATHARAYLDLNRAENELDPRLFSPQLSPHDLNVSFRVQAGLGAIPQYVAEDMLIYDQPLPAREAAKRIDTIHKPYHKKLAQLLAATITEHGIAFLIDCHSMPGEQSTKKHKGPDIVLGDCWGTACMRDLTDIAETLFLQEGFSVRRNVPYSGGYSTSSYGAPGQNIHALQIEINRALYMDEKTLIPSEGFSAVQNKIATISRNLIMRVSKLTGINPITLPRAAE